MAVSVAGSRSGYTQGMTSVNVPLTEQSPLQGWERRWQPGDVAIVRFHGVHTFAAAPGWTVKQEGVHAYAWRVLQHGDADWHVFHLAQAGDHVDWDLLIIDGDSLAPRDELDGSTVSLPPVQPD
jgi:hypothetical protein